MERFLGMFGNRGEGSNDTLGGQAQQLRRFEVTADRVAEFRLLQQQNEDGGVHMGREGRRGWQERVRPQHPKG